MIKDTISGLKCHVVADSELTCIRELEAGLRGRGSGPARSGAPEIVIVAMNSVARAEAALARINRDAPVVVVVGDEPEWAKLSGDVHVHRDDDLATAIEQAVAGALTSQVA